MAIGRPLNLTANVATKNISVIATANQTQFTVSGGYKINEIGVYRNGVRLTDGRDFTASDGSIVTLLSAATGGDVIEFAVFDSFNIANAMTSSGNQVLDGTLNVTGNLTSDGLVKIDTPVVNSSTNGENAKLQVDSSSQYDGLLLGSAATYGTISRGASNGALVYTANAGPANLGGGDVVTHEWWSGSSGGGGPNKLMVMTTSGNLGIGEPTPQYKVCINHDGSTTSSYNDATALRIDGPGAADELAGIGFGYFNSGGNTPDHIPSSWIGVEATDWTSYVKTDLIFSTRGVTTNTEPTERMRITSAGDVGIGTDNPTSDGVRTLEVFASLNPTIKLNDGGDYKALLQLRGNDLEIRGSNGQIEFYTGAADGASSTQRLTISNTGAATFADKVTTGGFQSGVTDANGFEFRTTGEMLINSGRGSEPTFSIQNNGNNAAVSITGAGAATFVGTGTFNDDVTAKDASDVNYYSQLGYKGRIILKGGEGSQFLTCNTTAGSEVASISDAGKGVFANIVQSGCTGAGPMSGGETGSALWGGSGLVASAATGSYVYRGFLTGTTTQTSSVTADGDAVVHGYLRAKDATAQTSTYVQTDGTDGITIVNANHTKATIDMDGVAQFDGNVQSGGNPIAAAANGTTILADSGIVATNSNTAVPLWRGYTKDDTTETSSILTSGKATFKNVVVADRSTSGDGCFHAALNGTVKASITSAGAATFDGGMTCKNEIYVDGTTTSTQRYLNFRDAGESTYRATLRRDAWYLGTAVSSIGDVTPGSVNIKLGMDGTATFADTTIVGTTPDWANATSTGIGFYPAAATNWIGIKNSSGSTATNTAFQVTYGTTTTAKTYNNGSSMFAGEFVVGDTLPPPYEPVSNTQVWLHGDFDGAGTGLQVGNKAGAGSSDESAFIHLTPMTGGKGILLQTDREGDYSSAVNSSASFEIHANSANSWVKRMKVRADGGYRYFASDSYEICTSVATNSTNQSWRFFTGATAIDTGTLRAYIRGDGGYYFAGSDVSDKDLKENITNLGSGSLNLIKQLTPCTYNFKVSEGYTDENRTGFIAQNVASVFGTSNGVATGTDGQKDMCVDYKGITAHLTAALQEAIAKIETLETKVAALEA